MRNNNNLFIYSLIQKNGYTFATVYRGKCVTIFLNQTLHWNVGSNDCFGWVDTRYVNILVSQMVYCCNSAYDHLPSLKGVFLLTYLGLLMKNHSQTTFRYPRDLLKKATGLKLRSFWRGNQQKHDIAEVRSQTTTRS